MPLLPGFLYEGPTPRGRDNGGFTVTQRVTAESLSAGSGATPPRTRTRRPVAPRNQREASDIADMMARMARALTKRARGGDLEALVALREVGIAVAVESQLAARALSESGDASWSMIALRLGESKRAVYARWGERSDGQA